MNHTHTTLVSSTLSSLSNTGTSTSVNNSINGIPPSSYCPNYITMVIWIYYLNTSRKYCNVLSFISRYCNSLRWTHLQAYKHDFVVKWFITKNRLPMNNLAGELQVFHLYIVDESYIPSIQWWSIYYITTSMLLHQIFFHRNI